MSRPVPAQKRTCREGTFYDFGISRERQSDPKQRVAVAVDCLADFGVDVVRMAAACQPPFAFSRA